MSSWYSVHGIFVPFPLCMATVCGLPVTHLQSEATELSPLWGSVSPLPSLSVVDGLIALGLSPPLNSKMGLWFVSGQTVEWNNRSVRQCILGGPCLPEAHVWTRDGVMLTCPASPWACQVAERGCWTSRVCRFALFLSFHSPFFSNRRCFSNMVFVLVGLFDVHVHPSRSLPFPCFLLFVFQCKTFVWLNPFYIVAGTLPAWSFSCVCVCVCVFSYDKAFLNLWMQLCFDS